MIKDDQRLHPWAYPAFLGLFVAGYLPATLFCKDFADVVMPLMTLHVAKHLLFFDGHIQPGMAHTLLSPSNVFLIYPPGIYLLSAVLPKVSSIYAFLFWVQLPVPFLLFRLIRRVAAPSPAVALSILSIHFFVNANWWAPDWIIQPLMLGAVLLLWTPKGGRPASSARLVTSGFLSGVMMVFKHNIGIFFAIAALTYLFIRSLHAAPTRRSLGQNAFLAFMLTGYLGFGFLFSRKLLYWDELVFYLFPYFVFWGGLAAWIFKRPEVAVRGRRFIKDASSFALSFLIVPGIIFGWIGSALGYARYGYALFGMGFQYLRIWDHGILATAASYAHFAPVHSLKAVFTDYHALILPVFFVLPWAVNCLLAGSLAWEASRPRMPEPETVDLAATSGLCVMGAFMFFPLEANHILVTKLFIYFLGLFFLAARLAERRLEWLAAGLWILAVPSAINVMARPASYFRSKTVPGVQELQSMIGLPLEETLARELGRQIEVLKKTVQGASYHMIDCSGGDLSSLLTMVDSRYPQLYLEMRPGMVQPEVAAAILASLQETRFAVVDLEPYRKYLSHQQEDPGLQEIFGFIRRHYEEAARYEAPAGSAGAPAHLRSFLVMRRV